MAKDDYLPREDSGFEKWLRETFNVKLPAHAATFGLTAAQLASVKDDTLNFSYWLRQSTLFKDEKEERVNYKNLLRHGPLGSPAGTPPTPPVIPEAPAGILPGIEPRIRGLVQSIKNHVNYTDTIGKDLDIIGDEQSAQKATLKPILKLALTGGGVNVKWTKGIADALRIEKQTTGDASKIAIPAAGGWSLLAIDTAPDYLDTTPITTPSVWKYRAIYILNDEMTGQWSDEAQIAVG